MRVVSLDISCTIKGRWLLQQRSLLCTACWQGISIIITATRDQCWGVQWVRCFMCVCDVDVFAPITSGSLTIYWYCVHSRKQLKGTHTQTAISSQIMSSVVHRILIQCETVCAVQSDKREINAQGRNDWSASRGVLYEPDVHSWS